MTDEQPARPTILYVPIAKTGSTTSRRVLGHLMDAHYTAQWVKRNKPDKWNAASVRVATIRNPYERMVAWWCRRHRAVPLPEFCRQVAAYEVGSIDHFHIRVPQVCWISSNPDPNRFDVGREDTPFLTNWLVRFELLEASLRTLAPHSDIPHLNQVKGGHPDWASVMDDESAKMIASMYACDFERLGYAV